MSQEKEKAFTSTLKKEDLNFEMPLRPQRLKDFIGQQTIVKRLSLSLGAAKQRQEPLGHCLFSGPPGLGKTTLAYLLSKEMGSSIVVTSGPLLEKPSDLAGILTNLEHGDILFIDEIHRINRAVEEYLYPAIEDFVLDVMIDKGVSARSVQVKLNPFTLVGATTRSGLLSSPMRSRFPLNFRLDYYNQQALSEIIERAALILKLNIDKSAAVQIAQRARGTPRIANNLLRWIRDYAQMHDVATVTSIEARQALEMLSIDEKGLEEIDKSILNTIIDHYHGGPVGLHTLAIAIGEDKQTLEEVYEPFLITQGFLKRTPRGRVATDQAFSHLGKKHIEES